MISWDSISRLRIKVYDEICCHFLEVHNSIFQNFIYLFNILITINVIFKIALYKILARFGYSAG